ncbi:MAG: hypothetical protein ACFE91_06775 [Promethearchaeota archaeon]
MNIQQNPIIKRIIDDLVVRYSDNIIAIYGIGSYFDDFIPPDWKRKDLDLIVIVKSLEGIPKQKWTDIRFKKKQMNGIQIWIGFNTIKAYQNRDTFNKESFSNYEWSLIEIKHSNNSKLLYGKDIRNQLPKIDELKFDFNDVLARGLYHLDKSLGEKESENATKELSKAIFKIGFYLCIFFDNHYRFTSIFEIGHKLKQINNNISVIMHEFFEEAIIYRITEVFKTNFNELREKFLSFIISALKNGYLHRKLNHKELIDYFNNTFSGFPNLIQYIGNKIG